MSLLVFNSGSSSIKFQIFDGENFSSLAGGLVDRIGEASGSASLRVGKTAAMKKEHMRIPDHHAGFQWIRNALRESGALGNSTKLTGIGHRIVHGGPSFTEPVVVDEHILEGLRAIANLAPLQNPSNIFGIEQAAEFFPDTPQVAVFDTAFHATLPEHAFRYALPEEFYTTFGVRRYGFHGISHHYVAKAAAAYLQKPLNTLNLISLHLGNGASATAIRQGQSVDTSMGMTPLEGLVMGTRCGDIDPAIPFFLLRETDLSAEELERRLNRGSGLKGLCGANDMREITQSAASGNHSAKLALDIYCYRIRKYIGAYIATLGLVDAIVFTAGVGENSEVVRQRCCEGLEKLGIVLDLQKNEAVIESQEEIQSDASAVKIFVIKTNEELEIAKQTIRCIETQQIAGNSV